MMILVLLDDFVLLSMSLWNHVAIKFVGSHANKKIMLMCLAESQIRSQTEQHVHFTILLIWCGKGWGKIMFLYTEQK